MTALVSCIIPVFNGERYIAETLDSILSQTYQPIEVLVVDDGSTDGTVKIVDGYGDSVRYIYQENAGAPAARNRGIEAAQGEFIGFLDADDMWHKEKLSRQIAVFDAREELGVCLTHQENFWIPELEQEEQRVRESGQAVVVPGALSTLVARRSVFNEIGLMDAALKHHDVMEWLGRAKENGITVDTLPDNLVSRRLHLTNASRNRGAAQHEEMFRTLKKKLDRRRSKTKPED